MITRPLSRALGAVIRYERTAVRPAREGVTETAPAKSESALANPQFRLLFIGNVVVMLGFGMMQVLQGVLAFDLTGKNSSVGFVAMGMGLPMLLLGPLGGALSDRMSKRMLLMFGQGGVGLVFLVIGLLTALDIITIWVLAGLTLSMGCAMALLMPARQAWVGDLLQGPALTHGIALQQLSMNGTRIVGPIVAGGLVAVPFLDVGGAYIAMAGLFIVAMGLLFLMEPTRGRSDKATTSVFGDLMLGLRYTWRTKDVRLLMLTFGGVVLTAFTYVQLMPGFLENQLDTDTKWVAVLFVATALGGIGITIFLTRNANRFDPSKLMFGSGLALAASVVLLAVSPTLPLALGASALVGAASSGFQMGNQVNLMQKTDPAFFGRVMSLVMTAFGSQMIAGFPAGALADAVGERITLSILAGCCLAVVTAGYLWSRTDSHTGRSRRPTAG